MKLGMGARARHRCAQGLATVLLVGGWSLVSAAAPAQAAPTTERAPSDGVELPELRTANSSTYRLPDGTKELRLSSEPLNYRDLSGRWRRIDNELVRDASGDLRNTANAIDVEIPADAAGDVTLSHRGRSLSFGIVGGDSDSTARPSGSVAAFEDAIDEVDATYEAVAGGVKETLVLPDRDASRRFAFEVEASGLTAALQPSGEVWFNDALGIRRFAFAAPWMQDADGVLSRAARYEVERVAGGDRVVLELDDAWLADPDRAYPVLVDPTVYTDPAGTCEITSGTAANLSRCDSGGMPNWIGREGTAVHRGLVAFDELDDLVDPSSIVLSARLRAWMAGQSANEPADVDVHHLTRDFQNGATWNRTNGRTLWTTPGGDFRAEREFRRTLRPDEVDGWIGWDVTDFAQRVVDLTEPSSNLLIKAADETRQHVDVLDHHHLELRYADRTGIDPQYEYDEHALSDGSVLHMNVGNGNIALSSTDLDFVADDGRFTVGRYFNTYEFGAPGTFGRGGRGDFGSVTLERDWVSGSYILFGASAVDGVFRKRPDGSFTAPEGMDATLAENVDGTLTLTFDDTAEVWSFDSSDPGHRLVASVEESGHRIDATYGPSGIATLRDTLGHSATFGYDSAGDLRTITDQAAAVHRYDYDSSHRLVAYTAPGSSASTQYRYDSSGRLATITAPDRSGLRVVYYSGSGSSLPEGITPFGTDGVDLPSTWYDGGTGYTTVERPGEPFTAYFFNTHLHTELVQTGLTPALATSGAIPSKHATYDRATAPLTVAVSAADVPDGVRQLVLDVDGAPVDSINGDCSSGCPRRLAGTLLSDFSTQPDGAYSFRVRALDDDSDASSSPVWNINIDRTPPTSATDVAFVGFLGGEAEIIWDRGEDPAAPDSTPGSGVGFSEVRWRIEPSGAWTAWTPVQDESLRIPGATRGQSATVEIRESDRVGNLAPVTSATVTLEEAEDNANVGVFLERDENGDPVFPDEEEPEARTEVPIGGCTYGTYFEYFPLLIQAWNDHPNPAKRRVLDDVIIEGAAWYRCRDPTGLIRIRSMELTVCVHMRGKDGVYHQQVCEDESHSVSSGTIGYHRLTTKVDLICRPGTRSYEMRLYAKPKRFPGGSREVNLLPVGREFAARTIPCNEADAWIYRATHSDPKHVITAPDGWTKVNDATILSSPSAELAKDLGAPPNTILNTPTRGWAAHHIVPARGWEDRGRGAQAAAYSCGIDPNGSTNGAWLRGYPLNPSTEAYRKLRAATLQKRAYHPSVHSRTYFNALENRLEPLVTAWPEDCRDRMRDKLVNVHNNLYKGTFPYLPGDPDPEFDDD